MTCFTHVLMGIYLPPAAPSSLESTGITEEERNTITGILIDAAIEVHRDKKLIWQSHSWPDNSKIVQYREVNYLKEGIRRMRS